MTVRTLLTTMDMRLAKAHAEGRVRLRDASLCRRDIRRIRLLLGLEAEYSGGDPQGAEGQQGVSPRPLHCAAHGRSGLAFACYHQAPLAPQQAGAPARGCWELDAMSPSISARESRPRSWRRSNRA